MRNVLDYDAWTLDEGVIAAPWRSLKPNICNGAAKDTFDEKVLRLGVIVEDPRYPLHPLVLRNFKAALAKLEVAGHTLIPLDT